MQLLETAGQGGERLSLVLKEQKAVYGWVNHILSRQWKSSRGQSFKESEGPTTLCHVHCCYQYINNLLSADPSKSILTMALPTTSALQGCEPLCQGLKTSSSCWSCSSCFISKNSPYFKNSVFFFCGVAGLNYFGLTTT